jgi:hypothetical protein
LDLELPAYILFQKAILFTSKTAYNTLGSGTTGLYTVPESHTFYIISASISAVNRSAALTYYPTIYTETINDHSILGVMLDKGVAGQNFPRGDIAVSFPIPFRMRSGEVIRTIMNANISVIATITGFLVPNNILKGI